MELQIDPHGFNTKQTKENETVDASKRQNSHKPASAFLVTPSPPLFRIPIPPPLPDLISTSSPALTLPDPPCLPVLCVSPPTTFPTPISPYSRPSASEVPNEQSCSKAKKFF